MTRQISEGRKTAYYIGSGMLIIGFLLFDSVFVIGAINYVDFSNSESIVIFCAFCALCGIALMIAGGIIRTSGARGLAGSGIILDPDKAKQDLEPYSRMAGGMVKDVSDEADINLNNPDGKSSPEKVITIKCPACGKINEEDSNFCQHCGKKT